MAMMVFCSDCKRETEAILDTRQGDTICTECSLVLESHHIDESSEWRIFADSDDNGKYDRERVGSKQNLLLDQANLRTFASNPNPKKGGGGGGPFVGSLNSLNQSNSSDKGLTEGFKMIENMADNLGLVRTIKDRACEIFKNVEDNKSCRGRNLKATVAATLYIACKELKLSRTLKEISRVADGVAMKEISRTVEVIKKRMEVETGGVQPAELVRRFCSKLNMNYQAIKAVEAVENFDIRRNPKSILAAIIYMIDQVSGSARSFKEIAIAAEVAEGTVKKSYNDVAPHASTLIPKWYPQQVHKVLV
ncbi:Transcription factor TFIIB [Corchorus capsularis]|uniref:Transcription factor TFIIB n=1 Tax=Corchorus capsularis TaxID=210143 RepID=A0A1R3HSZ8_COCAP|nr:Transcription factor TFIIB [Corchorus capsularis]